MCPIFNSFCYINAMEIKILLNDIVYIGLDFKDVTVLFLSGLLKLGKFCSGICNDQISEV